MNLKRFNLEEWLSIILFIILIFLSFAQILSRFLLNFSLAWTEELSRFAFIALVYISASLAILRERHIRVEFLESFLTFKYKRILKVITYNIWLILNIVIIYYGIDHVIKAFETEQSTPALEIQVWIILLIIPLTFTLMSIRIIQKIFKLIKVKEGG